MTTPKNIMFLAGVLLAGYTLSYILQGVWFDSNAQSVFGSLTILKVYSIAGLFSLPWVNWEFFTVGLPRLVSFNFGFFGGELAYFQYMLYVVSIGVIWGIVATMIAVLAGFWRK